MDPSLLRAFLRDILRRAPEDAPAKWDVMLMPVGSHEAPQTFQISRRYFQGLVLAVAAALLLIFAAWGFTLIHAHRARAREVAKLQQELRASRTELLTRAEHAEQEMHKVREEFESILEVERKMRALAGLKPRYNDGTEPAAGQGGRGSTLEMTLTESAREIDDEDAGLPPMPDWETVPLDKLFSEFGVIQDSYTAIEHALTQEQERLDSTPMINPVGTPEAWISSGFGYRTDPITGGKRFHEGLDIVAPRGTPILAPANGVVTYAGWKGGLGKHVVIQHGFGYETVYAHCDRLAVKKGDEVVRGQTIAYLGSTGRSTGPHLHYEVARKGKLVNPYRYIMD